jgi:hypothetical protein
LIIVSFYNNIPKEAEKAQIDLVDDTYRGE